MKKNILSLAVASGVAGLAATAQAAMYVNPEGTGEVLLFPYYNAQNGNETSMHIVNTTTDAKAVKVRFMEYVNSQEVLDFNLYLSAKDHFSFTVYGNPDGEGAAIITRDNSCTVPELGTGSGDYAGTKTENADGSITRIQPFLPYQYGSGTGADNFSSITRTLVGHVEVIEMGVLNATGRAADTDVSPAVTEFKPAAYATHGSDGVPANCAALVAAWSTGGEWLKENNLNSQIDHPSGGLYGVSNLLNNSDAAAYGMEAAAIADFWAGTTKKHAVPGSTDPSLVDGDVNAIVPNAGAYFSLEMNSSVDAVSALFMAESISNDVMANPALQGETDWVVTFPTRRYYVNGDAAVKPFTDLYVGSGTAGGPATSCEVVGISQIDREESATDPLISGPIFSPAPPDAPAGDPAKLCYETNTIAVNGVSATNTSVSTADVFDAAVSLAWGQDQPEGWQEISFVTRDATTGAIAATNDHWLEAKTASGSAGKRLNGLPVLGFAAFEYTNGAKNFGFVSDHKSSVSGSALTASG